MAIGTSLYAFTRPVPYLMVRGSAQTLSAPIRSQDGTLVAPASGTITITKPDGTNLVTAQAVTITGSIATYSTTPASTDTLGEGWYVIWSLVVGSDTYTYRQTAYLCEYVPPQVVTELDLYNRLPELRYRVPPAQTADRGDGTGWQSQIDGTYYELIQRLLDDGRRPWEIIEVTGYREWMIARACQRAVQAIPAAPDSTWAKTSVDLAHEVRRAEARMRIRYSVDDAGFRRGGAPVIYLMPNGRPSW